MFLYLLCFKLHKKKHKKVDNTLAMKESSKNRESEQEFGTSPYPLD